MKHCALYALMVATVLLPNATLAGTWTVRTVPELIAAIEAANQAGGSSTITLAAGRTFTLTAVNNTTCGPTGLPVIAPGSSVTLHGSGSTIARSAAAATPAFRLLVVAGGASLALDNLTVANGNLAAPAGMEGSAGAILVEAGAALTATQAAFVDNRAMGGDGGGKPGGNSFGGAIASRGAVTLDRVTFAGNQSIGGATRSPGGKVPAGSASDGAVSSVDPGTLVVTNCWFVGNEARGGARLRPSIFLDGMAASGAIGSAGASYIADSVFVGNRAIAGRGEPGVDGGLACGGAIGSGGPAVWTAACTVERCRFEGNQAIGGDAGPGNWAGNAIGGTLSDGFAVYGASMSVTDCSFVDNQATGGTGGMGGWGFGGVLNLEGPVLTFDQGGGCTTAAFTNCAFTGNQAVGTAPGGLAEGGAFHTGDYNTGDGSGAELLVVGCTFDRNEALGAPGGLAGWASFGAGGAIDANGKVTILGSTFTGNRAVGAPLAPGAVPTYEMASQGGALAIWGGVLEIRDSRFVGNQAIGASGTAGAGCTAMGGALEIGAGHPASIVDCVFSGNTATGGAGSNGGVGGAGIGGAIDAEFYPAGTPMGPRTVVTAAGTTFSGNEAVGGDGLSGGEGIGGACAVGTAVRFGLQDNSWLALGAGTVAEGNRAIGGAGGAGGTGGSGHGGAAAVLAGGASLADSTLSGNLAGGGAGLNGGSGRGGGLYNLGMATLAGSTVTGNRAVAGVAAGGTPGVAQGGGVYSAWQIVVDVLTRILGNKPDDRYGF